MLIIQLVFHARHILRSTRGQDLIEYALMAGFVAVSAGAIMPGVAESISAIFMRVGCYLTYAAQGGILPGETCIVGPN